MNVCAHCGQPLKATVALVPSGEFEAWYQEYPRKKAPLAARKAYDKARKVATGAELLAGLRCYQFSDDPLYIPYPASWLNAGHWRSEPDPAPKRAHDNRSGILRDMGWQGPELEGSLL